jgi:hypothetical protein
MHKITPLFYLPALHGQMLFGSLEDGVKRYPIEQATLELVVEAMSLAAPIMPGHAIVLCFPARIAHKVMRHDGPFEGYLNPNLQRGVVLTGFIGTIMGLVALTDLYLEDSLKFIHEFGCEAMLVEFNPSYLNDTVKKNSIKARTEVFLDSVGIKKSAVRASIHTTAQNYAE